MTDSGHAGAKPLTCVVMGSGAMAEHHLHVLAAHPETRPVALVSRHKERADLLATRAGVTRHDTLEAALDTHPDVQVVDVCNANAGHAPAALESIGRGKHVLIEKPVAFTAGEVEAIASAAAARRVVACTVLPKRFSSGVAAAHRVIASMRRPLVVRSIVGVPRPSSFYARPERATLALAGGGALLYHGIHDIDVLVSLFGPAEAVGGTLANLAHAIEVEDTCVASLRFSNDVVASFEVSTAPTAPALVRHTVMSADHMLAFDEFRAVSMPRRHARLWPMAWPLDRIAGRLTRRAMRGGSYADVVQDFVAQIRGQRMSRSHVATTITTHRVVEELYAAAGR
jgi:predicted dehydrogenase